MKYKQYVFVYLLDMYGDIVIGFCNDDEVGDILRYVKEKCQHGCPLILKKTDLDEYYLSVPIVVCDPNNTNVIVSPMVRTNPFYFGGLYVPDTLTCITYDTETQCFVSNVETDVYTYKPFAYEKTMYLILPITQYLHDDIDVRVHEHMRIAKHYFVCTG